MEIQKVTLKGLVCQDGKVFMLKDRSGNWELPGGRIDFGETPEETLKREFHEELGIDDVEIGKVINIWSFISNAHEDKYHFIVVIFSCKADLSKLKISDEHLEYKWVGLDEIDKYPMRDGYRETLRMVAASDPVESLKL